LTGPVGYYTVDGIKKSMESLQEAGVQVRQDVRDVGSDKLIAILQDSDKNIIGLIQEP